VPTRATEVFSTAVDNQDFVNVHVLQGERGMAVDNKSLATFQLVGIAPAPRGVPRIQVAFDLDADGLLTVSATDLGTGAEQTIQVIPTSGLGETDIERIVAEAGEAKQRDQDRRELAEVRNQAETLLYTSERAVAEFGHVLSAAERKRVEEDIAACRRVLAAGSAAQVRQHVELLEKSIQRIGSLLYSSGPAGGGDDSSHG
jgi:molecular chaperone DnaK